jgi:heme oxygenase
MPVVLKAETRETVRREVDLVHAQASEYPWESRRAYAEWLAQTYFYVRRVSHVLAAAAARTHIDNGALHEHLLSAIGEEGEHAIMLLNDLADLNFRIDQFSEHPLTTAYYQTLFYMIDYEGPSAILGYFAVLEGLAGAKGRGIHDIVSSSFGGRAISFLHEHIVADAEHYPRFFEVIDRMVEPELQVIRKSATLSGAIYRYMLRTIAAELPAI